MIKGVHKSKVLPNFRMAGAPKIQIFGALPKLNYSLGYFELLINYNNVLSW